MGLFGRHAILTCDCRSFILKLHLYGKRQVAVCTLKRLKAVSTMQKAGAWLAPASIGDEVAI